MPEAAFTATLAGAKMIHFDYSKDDFYWAMKMPSIKDSLQRGIWNCNLCNKSAIVMCDNYEVLARLEAEFRLMHSHEEDPDPDIVTTTQDGRQVRKTKMTVEMKDGKTKVIKGTIVT